jgi:Putative zinc-finger
MHHLSASQLNEYLDNTLEATTREAVAEHLTSCTECRARLEEIRSIFGLLAELPESPLQHDLRSRILPRLRQKHSPSLNPFFAAQLGAALGTVLWLVVATSTLIQIPIVRLGFPEFQFPNADLLTLRLVSQAYFPSLLPNLIGSQFVIPDLSSILPHLPGLEGQLSVPHLALLIAGTLFVGLIGNAFLLSRSPQERK